MIIKRSILGLCLTSVYLLGSYRGYIALWQEGSGTPVRVFPYSVASLPTMDQQALEQGISIGSETELNRLLEDYLS